METLLILGQTSRNHTKKSFGAHILIDRQQRKYQIVEERYEKLLRRDNSFDHGSMRAFDFKLPKAEGKVWPEPPRVGSVVSFLSTIGNELLCAGRVSYVHLGRKRSVGIIYLDQWEWYSNTVPDFTN